MAIPKSTAVATPAAAAPAAVASTVTRHSIVQQFAQRLGVEPAKLIQTLKDTAFQQPSSGGKPGPEVTDAQMVALLVVANEYGLNPFTKEIYAFPNRGGGIVPIISIDGWIRIINTRPELEAIDFEYPPDGTDKGDWWVQCTIKRSDRTRPVVIREYYSECYRNTDPWNQMGRRMLRHKALIQCGRVAFGYGGVYDPDEAERIANANAIPGEAREVHSKPATAEPVSTRAALPSKATPEAAAAAPAAQPAGALPADDMREIYGLLDLSGVPENALLAKFEVGDALDLSAAQRAEAITWLRGVNNG